MDIKIEEVKSDRELRKFINFPVALYKDNPFYVPPLMMDEFNTLSWRKNTAFDFCEVRYWLAYRDEKVVGRIAAIKNKKHIEKWDQAYLRFGWFDFQDDINISNRLLDKVEAWAKESKLTAVHGPLGFTDLDREGLLIFGFDELGTLATNYNYPYYQVHLEKKGYIKDVDWLEYEIIPPSSMNPKVSKTAELVLKKNELSLLRVKSKKDLLIYAKHFFDLINSEYSHLYGTFDLTDKQIYQYISQYFGFAKIDFIPVILDKNKQVVAFGIAFPSLSKALIKTRGKLFPFGWFTLLRALNKNDRADLYLVAIKSAYQGKGVNAILMDEMLRAFIKNGIKKVETNPELENNLAVQTQWKYFEIRQHKKRRCYIKYF